MGLLGPITIVFYLITWRDMAKGLLLHRTKKIKQRRKAGDFHIQPVDSSPEFSPAPSLHFEYVRRWREHLCAGGGGRLRRNGSILRLDPLRSHRDSTPP